VKEVRINCDKYLNKCWGAVSLPSRDAEEVSHKDEKQIERRNKEREVCLNCTKKKCSGTYECFRKERNKRNG
jgi:hypothetical protein